MSDPTDIPSAAACTGPLRTRRFRLVSGQAVAELDLCERPETPALPDLELALMAPGLRTRVVASVPRARLLRFATAQPDLAGAGDVQRGRQFGDYSVRVALRDLPLDADAFRQLLDWAADLRH